jgi:hypothetical protein
MDKLKTITVEEAISQINGTIAEVSAKIVISDIKRKIHHEETMASLDRSLGLIQGMRDDCNTDTQ